MSEDLQRGQQMGWTWAEMFSLALRSPGCKNQALGVFTIIQSLPIAQRESTDSLDMMAAVCGRVAPSCQ
jgi:hypothetical protein